MVEIALQLFAVLRYAADGIAVFLAGSHAFVHKGRGFGIAQLDPLFAVVIEDAVAYSALDLSDRHPDAFVGILEFCDLWGGKRVGYLGVFGDVLKIEQSPFIDK